MFNWQPRDHHLEPEEDQHWAHQATDPQGLCSVIWTDQWDQYCRPERQIKETALLITKSPQTTFNLLSSLDTAPDTVGGVASAASKSATEDPDLLRWGMSWLLQVSSWGAKLKQLQGWCCFQMKGISANTPSRETWDPAGKSIRPWGPWLNKFMIVK